MLTTRRRENREKGIALMTAALMLVFMIPIVGLSIDVGVLWMIRARMAAACDAAALATARNLNVGLTLSAQTANAVARGSSFFLANFPAGSLGTTNVTPSIVVAQSNASTLTVSATATGSAPLYFMRFLGSSANLAGAAGTASRRDVNLMLVLDQSGSMAGTPCADMISASKSFTNMFMNGRDTLGLVTFSTGAQLKYAPDKQFKTNGALAAQIDLVSCGGWTNTSYAYYQAYQQLVTINQPLALNLIVLFTDGNPTAFTAKFPIKTVTDTRYGYTGGSCGSGSTCSIAKSTCKDDNGKTYNTGSNTWQSGWGTFAPKLTVIAGNYDMPYDPDTGNDNSSTFTGCTLVSNTNDYAYRRDFAYIPNTDANGVTMTGYKSTTTVSSGSYVGKLRIDDTTNLDNVAYNTAVNAATVARNNATLNVLTYTIGLGSNGGVDADFLMRMSNDLASPTFDNTKVPGLYVFAPNSTDLNQAFARVASEILRIAQ